MFAAHESGYDAGTTPGQQVEGIVDVQATDGLIVFEVQKFKIDGRLSGMMRW
jgi:hypothetical protein